MLVDFLTFVLGTPVSERASAIIFTQLCVFTEQQAHTSTYVIAGTTSLFFTSCSLIPMLRTTGFVHSPHITLIALLLSATFSFLSKIIWTFKASDPDKVMQKTASSSEK